MWLKARMWLKALFLSSNSLIVFEGNQHTYVDYPRRY